MSLTGMTLIHEPCVVCGIKVHELSPAGTQYCIPCYHAKMTFWDREDTDCDEARYDQLMIQMSTLCSMFPTGQRERFIGYQHRMRAIFARRFDLSSLPANLRQPFPDALVAKLQQGYDINQVLAEFTPAKIEATKLRGSRARADIDKDKGIRKVEPKPTKQKVSL
jgi:hypothetical protein